MLQGMLLCVKTSKGSRMYLQKSRGGDEELASKIRPNP